MFHLRGRQIQPSTSPLGVRGTASPDLHSFQDIHSSLCLGMQCSELENPENVWPVDTFV